MLGKLKEQSKGVSVVGVPFVRASWKESSHYAFGGCHIISMW